MKKRNRKRASAGFSLVEVVAAITVLGLVVAGVSTSLVTSIQFNARTEQRLQAELAVANAVERMRAVGYVPDTNYDGVTVTWTEDAGDNDAYDPPVHEIYGYLVTVQSAVDEDVSITTYAIAGGGGGG